STRRSTSISPAAITPVRSTTSATSDCWPARCRRPRTAIRSRDITCTSAADSGPTRQSRRKSTATSKPMTRRDWSSACSRPISHPPLPAGTLPCFRPPPRHRRAAIAHRQRGAAMMLLPQDPLPSLIPDSAPFSAEQRVWLNGLFAGLLSLDGSITALSPEQATALLPGALDLAASTSQSLEDDDGAPWHDPAMPLADRMKLAEGRPLRRRMMAAMGQQDCGQCGYNCQDYSDAIFREKEKRLNLCVPGGKETARMLKALHQEIGGTPAAPEIRTPAH